MTNGFSGNSVYVRHGDLLTGIVAQAQSPNMLGKQHQMKQSHINDLLEGDGL